MCNKQAKVSIKNRFIQNARLPKGIGGKKILARMNGGTHRRLAEWGFSHISPNKQATALDIGCGGGANISFLLKICPDGCACGVDYARVSVRESSRFNRAEIKQGRCTIVQADASSLPFEKETFDLVTAFETVYFWQNISVCFEQVKRVLKYGGKFLICNETDGTKSTDEEYEKTINGMRIYTADEICSLLIKSGFDINCIDTEIDKHWLCIVACKP